MNVKDVWEQYAFIVEIIKLLYKFNILFVKYQIPSYDPKNIHRVCNVCNQEMLLINSNKKKF